MYTSLQDLIATCPNELEANSIIVFDGCHWIVQSIPDGITCEDVQDCIDCEFLLGILTFGTGLIVNAETCTITVDPTFVDANITASFSCAT